jgi:hypothetical protein
MTRRRKISWLIVISATAALIAIVLHDRFVAGPVYEGTPLSVWLRLLNQTGPQANEQPRQAIRQLGPAALPLVVEWLDWKDSLLRRALNAWVAGDPQHVDFQPLSPKDRRRIALEACDILGPAAQPAIPKLVAIATSRNPELDAPFLIARIGGSNAPPALARISASTNKFLSVGAGLSLELLKQSSPLVASSPSPGRYQRQLQEYHVLVLQAVTSGKPVGATNSPVR